MVHTKMQFPGEAGVDYCLDFVEHCLVNGVRKLMYPGIESQE